MITFLIRWLIDVGERLRSHPLALALLGVIGTLSSGLLIVGWPGFLKTTHLGLWEKINNPGASAAVELLVLYVAVLVTFGVLLAEVLVMSICAGVVGSRITHKYVRLTVLITLAFLGFQVHTRWTWLLSQSMAITLVSAGFDPYFEMFNKVLEIMTLTQLIASMFMAVPIHILEDLMLFKMAERVFSEKEKQAVKLIQEETKVQIQLIRAGQPANIGGLLGSALELLHPRPRQLTGRSRAQIVNQYPGLAPFAEDLYLKPGGQLAINTDGYGRTARGGKFVGQPAGSVIEMPAAGQAQLPAPQPALQQPGQGGGPAAVAPAQPDPNALIPPAPGVLAPNSKK